MTVRRVLAVCALIALVGLHLDYKVASFPFLDREALHRAFTAMPDGRWGEYPRFLEGVRAHTKTGDRIAVIVPNMQWDGGYSYAYYRASYFLTGREVLPLLYRTDAPIRENFGQAEYLAVWNAPAPQAHVVWQGNGGVLLSRR
jgi:hypothetical protein